MESQACSLHLYRTKECEGGTMDEATLETMMQHLARLEREQRWWQRWAIATTTLLGLLIFLGIIFSLRTIDTKNATVADVLQAKRFVLIDDDGKLRAELSIDKQQLMAGLKIYDSEGTSRVALQV